MAAALAAGLASAAQDIVAGKFAHEAGEGLERRTLRIRILARRHEIERSREQSNTLTVAPLSTGLTCALQDIREDRRHVLLLVLLNAARCNVPEAVGISHHTLCDVCDHLLAPSHPMIGQSRIRPNSVHARPAVTPASAVHIRTN